MNRTIACGMLLIFPFLMAAAQPEGGGSTESILDHDSRYASVHLQKRDGGAVVGILTGLHGDTLSVLYGGVVHEMPLAAIRRLQIESSPNAWNSVLFGTILGAYLGTIASGQSSADPFGYLEGYMDFFPATLLYALPGAALIGLIGMSTGTAWETFTFGETDEEITETVGEFKEFLAGGMPSRSVHLTVQGGWFSRRSPPGNVRIQYSPPSPYGDYYYYAPWDKASSVNLVRKVQATVSLLNWLEAGAALIQLSEPSTGGYTTTRRTDTLLTYVHYTESLDATAYVLIGCIEPLRQIRHQGITWKVGAGIGIATIDVESVRVPAAYQFLPSPWNPSYRYMQLTQGEAIDAGFSTRKLALSLFTSVDLRPCTWLTVGFAWDYTFCPGVRRPAVPEWSLPEETIGSTCIGFTFGVHL